MAAGTQAGGGRSGLRVMYAVGALVLLYGALLAFGSPAGFPPSAIFHGHMPYLSDKPVGEDGYYMLTVADNIARTGRVTYNYDLQTTGIQPLATFIFAGLDWMVLRAGGSEILFVRSVLFFGVVLSLVFAWQMSRLARALAPDAQRSTAAVLAFLFSVTNYTLFRLFTYGLETGVYLCALASCVAVTLRIGKAQRASWTHAMLLGISGGMAGLARIDFGLLYAAVLLVLLLRGWIRPVLVGMAGAVAAAIVSPWFWYLHRVTGSWVPSSGKAESRLISGAEAGLRLKTLLLSIFAEAAPWSYGGMSKLTTAVTLVSVVALAWVWISGPGRRMRAECRSAVVLAEVWLPGLLLISAVYPVFFFSTHFYHRYMAPWAVVTIPLLAILIAQMDLVAQRLSMVGAVLALFFAAWTVGALHTGHVGNTQTIAAAYVQRYYPDTKVGAFQSGAMGFFNRNVENLDGKLNMEAWKAEQAHQLPEFLDREGIQVIVDWPSVIRFFVPAEVLRTEWQPCPVPLFGTESECLIRRPARLNASR